MPVDRKSKKHAQLIKHGTAQAKTRMKPSFEKCSSCETTLIQVEKPAWRGSMSSKGITVLLHLMKKFIRSDRCFSKMPYHHSVSLIQSSPNFDQVCKQVGKKDIGTSTTTHSIFPSESSLTDKEACMKLTQ